MVTWRVESDLALEVDSLTDGMPGISPVLGAALAEATSVCLDSEDHQSPTEMSIGGATRLRAELTWHKPSSQAGRTWGDPEVATEHGAYGIASLVVSSLSPLTVVERSKKGTGFDYWLGDDASGPLFQGMARMEVSGLRSGSDSAVKSRVRQKVRQVERSQGSGLPAVVVVVEFGSPQCLIAEP